MKLLVVNYHYIGKEASLSPFPSIYPVSPEILKRNLEELSRLFTFISKGELEDAVDGKKNLPDNSCLITFDDGLRCQYEIALPILNEMGIPAVFFVNGIPMEGIALDIHKVQWMRAHTDARILFEEVSKQYEKFSGKDFWNECNKVSEEELKLHYSYDPREQALIKFMFSKGGMGEFQHDVIWACFKKFFGEYSRYFDTLSDESEFIKDWYMTPKMLSSLAEKDMLGSHSYDHVGVGWLDLTKSKEQFEYWKRAMGKVGVNAGRATAFSYPFGRSDQVSSSVADVASEEGFKIGFTMERAFNTTLNHPLLFARLDANDVPGGKRPLFEIKDGYINILNKDLTIGRKIYIQE